MGREVASCVTQGQGEVPGRESALVMGYRFHKRENLLLKRARHRPGLTRGRKNPPESLRRQGGTPHGRTTLTAGGGGYDGRSVRPHRNGGPLPGSDGRKKTGNENKKPPNRKKPRRSGAFPTAS